MSDIYPDYLDFETTPAAESCEQVGPNYNRTKAKAEARAFIAQMLRVYGQPPEGCRFKIITCPHDFGSYINIRVIYSDQAGCDYVFEIDANPIEEWDDEAREELGLPQKE